MGRVIIINITQIEAWKNAGKIKPLLKALKKEASEEMLKAVIAALGDIGDKRAVPAIFKVMEAKNKYGVSLSGGKAIIKIINDNNDIDLIFRMINHRDKEIQKEAKHLIWGIQVKKRNIDMLLKKLKHKNEKIRIGAAMLLGNIKDDRTVIPLLEVLKDKEAADYAIQSLGKIGDKRAVEPLIKMLGSNKSYYDDTIATALGRIGDKRAIEPLINMVYTHNIPYDMSNSGVFEAVSVAFLAFGDKRALPALIYMCKLTGVQSWQTKCKIIEVIGELGDASVVNFLIKEPLGYGSESYSSRSAARRALVKIGSDAVEPLIETLNNIVGEMHTLQDNYYRHKEAIEALAQIGDKRAEQQLRYELKRTKNESLRFTLERALEKMEKG